MSNPLVSVVMATYNGAEFLLNMLDSIITQSYKNLEIIIVDDGSTDQTREILTQAAKLDGRICLKFSDVNQGAMKSFEMALKLTKGEFVVLADQDDVFRRDKIELQLKHMLERPTVDLVLSDLCLIDETGSVINESMWKYQRLHVKNGKPFKQLLYANFVTGCATMIRRRLLDLAFPFPDACIMHDWWLGVLSTRYNGGGISLIAQPLTYYRQHSSNVIGAHSGGLIDSFRRVPFLAERCEWHKKNEIRLEKYLSDRAQLWSADDRLEIQQLIDVFTYMSRDETNTFYTRLSSIKIRINYARYFGWVHSLGILLFTFFPRFADWVKISKI